MENPIRNWRDHKVSLGFIAAVVVAATPVWQWLDTNIIFTPAQAAEDHANIIRWELEETRDEIRDVGLRIVEVKYDPDLPTQAKEELIVGYDADMAELKKKEACLEEDRLDC